MFHFGNSHNSNAAEFELSPERRPEVGPRQRERAAEQFERKVAAAPLRRPLCHRAHSSSEPIGGQGDGDEVGDFRSFCNEHRLVTIATAHFRFAASNRQRKCTASPVRQVKVIAAISCALLINFASAAAAEVLRRFPVFASANLRASRRTGNPISRRMSASLRRR